MKKARSSSERPLFASKNGTMRDERQQRALWLDSIQSVFCFKTHGVVDLCFQSYLVTKFVPMVSTPGKASCRIDPRPEPEVFDGPTL